MQDKRQLGRRPIGMGRKGREPVNEKIEARRVRVIYEEKGINEVMDTKDALEAAREDGLDLVEISSEGEFPVCKIVDYGKFLFHREKKTKEARKNQKQVLLKEIKMRPVIDVHDFNFKVKHAKEFLQEGHRVKVSIRFRGRELGYQDGARALMEKIKEATGEVARVDSGPSMEGRDMVMILVAGVKR